MDAQAFPLLLANESFLRDENSGIEKSRRERHKRKFLNNALFTDTGSPLESPSPSMLDMQQLACILSSKNKEGTL